MDITKKYSSDPSPSFAIWFGALIGSKSQAGQIGQTSTNASPISPGYKEGQFMRTLFRQRAHAMAQSPIRHIAQSTNQGAEQHWQTMLAQARSEGLLPVHQTLRSSVTSANQSRYILVASIAVLAIGSTALLQQMQNEDQKQADTVVFRGDEHAQRIPVAAGTSTVQFAEKIELVLNEQALKDPVVRYRRTVLGPNMVQIQAKVAPRSDAAKALALVGVTVPEHGRLNLIIEAPKGSDLTTTP